MVTKYRIPCSYCGKIVERYVFCSGACKVKGYRERQAKKETLEDLPSNPMPENTYTPPPVKLSTARTASESSTETVYNMFSDNKKSGYHYNDMLGKYIKDAD